MANFLYKTPQELFRHLVVFRSKYGRSGADLNPYENNRSIGFRTRDEIDSFVLDRSSLVSIPRATTGPDLIDIFTSFEGRRVMADRVNRGEFPLSPREIGGLVWDQMDQRDSFKCLESLILQQSGGRPIDTHRTLLDRLIENDLDEL